jgi:FKBP-type peptidyl-prolyl cis-trans isomerase
MPIRQLTLALVLCLGLVAATGCVKGGGSQAAKEGPTAWVPGPNAVTMPSGIVYEDVTIGAGPKARAGLMLSVHYTGWLTDGTQFDTSLKKVRPFIFRLGRGEVIKGWDEGLVGMRVGSRRYLRIPPALAYGAKGVPGLIPPNATLVFLVELFGVN